MNYGKKFLHIIMAAAGMMICVIGIAYKTGYFTGASATSSTFFLIAGAIVTIYGLVRLKND